ncbi:hypothetical protein ACJMK2_008137 [Sinanodonta woodiana]|uniref:Cytochrome P450 n=1 Tax=Sinanodonta woodiana TaxID=1069815 RepID=A0ABD3VKM6_SINWO
MSEANDFLPVNCLISMFTILNITFVACGGYFIYRIIKFIVSFHYQWSVFQKVQGPTDYHCFYGNLHTFPKDCGEDVQIAFILNLVRKYPKYFRLWRGPFIPTIVVYHPDTVKQILKTSDQKPMGLSANYGFLLPWLGPGLVIAKESQWKRSRRLLSPAFHFDILKPYIAIYNDAANVLEKLAVIADTGKPFEVFEAISLCTLDIIMRCAFSYHTDCQRQKETHPYVQAVHALTDIVEYRARNPILYPDFIFYLTKRGREFLKCCKFVHSVAERVIYTRRKTLEKEGVSSGKFLDLVDILLTARDETGDGLTPLEIRNETDTFMFGGHDTTSSAMSWILYSLAEHMDVQNKVRIELDSVLEGRQSDDLLWDDLPLLEYMGMVIKEAMRQHCPVPVFARQLKTDDQIDGHILPAGTTVVIDLYMLHHNEEVWERPMEFIPERFSKENASKIDPFQFIPFSAGHRNCIGQKFGMNEMKVILSKLVHRYKFELEPSHIPQKKASLVMRAVNGILLRVSSR